MRHFLGGRNPISMSKWAAFYGICIFVNVFILCLKVHIIHVSTMLLIATQWIWGNATQKNWNIPAFFDNVSEEGKIVGWNQFYNSVKSSWIEIGNLPCLLWYHVLPLPIIVIIICIIVIMIIVIIIATIIIIVVLSNMFELKSLLSPLIDFAPSNIFLQTWPNLCLAHLRLTISSSSYSSSSSSLSSSMDHHHQRHHHCKCSKIIIIIVFFEKYCFPGC